jgi:hypothetical protein
VLGVYKRWWERPVPRRWLPIHFAAMPAAGRGSSSGADEASSASERQPPYGGKVLQSSLSNETEQRLQEALDAGATAST